MEQQDETNPTSYPLGRGYGHDYMRGGEVFGGYGYRDREEYLRTRGGELPDSADPDFGEIYAAGSAIEAGDGRDRPPHGEPQLVNVTDGGPVPHLEHTYGNTGSAWRHSRSYYVTQAQLQQRFYAPRPRAGGPYSDRISTLSRDDAEVRRDVQETLFHDTWVDADNVEIDVADGTVTLRGELPSAHEIRFARDDAWAVAGVRNVICQINVLGDAERQVPESD
ncbi:MAG: BON domain-containing protein [Gemmatimonadota bacterium]|nr:BON domain-containing protein [Gemmatimonadota bacterium]